VLPLAFFDASHVTAHHWHLERKLLAVANATQQFCNMPQAVVVIFDTIYI